MEKDIVKKEQNSKSIIKSDNFNERFSELEKISEKARKINRERNTSRERVQRSDQEPVRTS